MRTGGLVFVSLFFLFFFFFLGGGGGGGWLRIFGVFV